MTNKAIRVIPKHVATLRLLQSVVVDDNMKVLHLPGERFRNLYSKRFCGLRQQRLFNVSIRYPNHLPAVVIETCNNMRNVHGLAAFVEQFAAENRVSLSIGIDLLVHDSNDWIG